MKGDCIQIMGSCRLEILPSPMREGVPFIDVGIGNLEIETTEDGVGHEHCMVKVDKLHLQRRKSSLPGHMEEQ